MATARAPRAADTVDRILRGAPVPWPALAVWAILGCAFYGAVMGCYGGRVLQAVYAAIKVPVLLFAATIVVLPSFFMLNTVLGLRDDFPRACRGLLSTQASVSLALASLGPVAVLGYLSVPTYAAALVTNGVMFAIASLGGQVALARAYAPLIKANPRHKIGLAAWLVLYSFVAIQLAWMLRPFVGWPGLETTFLREEMWGNAYVRVFEAIRGAIGR